MGRIKSAAAARMGSAEAMYQFLLERVLRQSSVLASFTAAANSKRKRKRRVWAMPKFIRRAFRDPQFLQVLSQALSHALGSPPRPSPKSEVQLLMDPSANTCKPFDSVRRRLFDDDKDEDSNNNNVVKKAAAAAPTGPRIRSNSA